MLVEGPIRETNKEIVKEIVPTSFVVVYKVLLLGDGKLYWCYESKRNLEKNQTRRRLLERAAV